jgi:KUP system potassium uptake protein
MTSATPPPPAPNEPATPEVVVPAEPSHISAPAKAGLGALTFGALGVVFGDIGTSPLYAMKETFDGPHKLAVGEANVYGVLSLIFWSITIIVSLKYVTFIMRADNDGEGGIMALIAKVQNLTFKRASTPYLLVALGIFGAALFYGDSMITPAISVLSAVEGIEVAAPSSAEIVIPIAVTVLTLLFLVQHFGTSFIGRFFGPVMAVWFAALAALGIAEIVTEPAIIRSLSPHYAWLFLTGEPKEAFLALGSVVLAVTGAEALYADMGHFGKSPIRRAWFFLVMPALFLNYMGQGALLINEPSAISSPFYGLVPESLQMPMIVLATLAAVIASQAVISGAFSVTRQAVQLGFLPRVNILQTSRREVGQIYIPAINWGLYVAIVALVIGFGSSTALASAYGIAVTGTLAIDTILFFVVVRMLWHKPLWLVLPGLIGFLVVDLAFFTANLTKVFHGGWFPLLIAAAVFTVLMTWRRGRIAVVEERTREEGRLADFVVKLKTMERPPLRVAGTAVYLNADAVKTPLALLYNLKHNHVVHQEVLVVSIETIGVPVVAAADRYELDDVEIPDDGIWLITARFGFQEEPDVPALLRRVQLESGLPIDVDHASYFLSRTTIAIGKHGGMAHWRKRLFVSLQRNEAGRAGYFCLPPERVVAFGSQLEI